MSVDVSPSGGDLIFDLLGDIYRLPIAGGDATPLLTGIAFESQPVYAPSGKEIAFISDRSGNENLWVSAADGTGLRQLTFLNDNTEFVSPEWSFDGKSIFVSTLRPEIGGYELWRVDAKKGGGERVTRAKAAPNTQHIYRHNSLAARPFPDGEHVAVAERYGIFNYPPKIPSWRVVKRKLTTGETLELVTAPGSAMRPALSPDGQWLVYATRENAEGVLRLRNLANGDDRVLVRGSQVDKQEAYATLDVVPRFDFTPDGKAVVFTSNAKLERVEIETGERRPIPFNVHVELDVGPTLRRSLNDVADYEGPVQARVIMAPHLSPTGKHAAFSAFGRIYHADSDGGDPVRLTNENRVEAEPIWSPDSRSIAYVSWDNEGGSIWRADVASGTATAIVNNSAFYTDPAFAPDGASIYALRSSGRDHRRAPMDYFFYRRSDLVRIDLSNGHIQKIASGNFGGAPQFDQNGRMYISSKSGMQSVDQKTGKTQTVLSITGPSYYFMESRTPAADIRISPDGKWALAQVQTQLYLVQLSDKSRSLDVGDPNAPIRRLTNIGADFVGWAEGGKTIYWALGSTLYKLPFSPDLLTGEIPTAQAVNFKVALPRDYAAGTLVLRGATAITMKGDEIVKNADIVIENGTIAAIGRRGAVDLPRNANIRNIKGKYVLPGLIDTHAHWSWVRHNVLEEQPPQFLSYLTYGVTAGLDPSTLSIDFLAYDDLVRVGRTIGPRAFSTGPAVFSYAEINTLDDARNILRRYKDHYKLRNIKQYRVGNRRQRQLFAMAADELELLPTTEGADNLKLSLTQIIDGFAGLEHAMPSYPLGADVLTLLEKMQTSYTLTLLHLPAGTSHFFTQYTHQKDEKLYRFLPPEVIQMRAHQVRFFADGAQFTKMAADGGRAVVEQGGLLGVGSHSELGGLSYHWEMFALAMSGMAPHEVLRAATIGSAETIGRASDLGSLEAGKRADIIILDENPLKSLENTLSISLVMKNGRLYDAEFLTEIWPRKQKLPPLWFHGEMPK